MALEKTFFENTPQWVARALLGLVLCRETEQGLTSGIIVETEAYLSRNDSASHAFRGMTKRNKTMFGPAGHAYIYFIYGNHFCLNVTTGLDGSGEAVLIRAVKPISGLDLMHQRRGPIRKRTDLANGPGKLCQAFAIDKSLDGHDLQRKPLYIEEEIVSSVMQIKVTPRIGVSSAREKKLRYIISGSNYLSRRESFE